MKKVDEIKAREITISFVSKRYPSKVIRHLEKELHLQVRKLEKGIYYVYGDYFPIQFVVTSQLTEEINFWLHNLTNDLKEVSSAEKLLNEYKNYRNDNLHQSVMNIIINANREIFEEASDMCEALYEIMKDKIEAKVQEQVNIQLKEQLQTKVEEQVKEKMTEIEEQGKVRGQEQTLISLVKDGLINITEAAKRLSVSEEEFLEKMKPLQS